MGAPRLILLSSIALCFFVKYIQGMDREAYRSIVEMAMKPRVEGEDGDDAKKAIQELVITHYNIVMGRHYTIGSTTGVLSGKRRRKRFASFGSSWTSGTFDNGWDTSRSYGGYGGGGFGGNNRGYGSGSDGYSSRNTGYGSGGKDFDDHGSKGYGSSGKKGYGSGSSSGYGGGNDGYDSRNTGHGDGGKRFDDHGSNKGYGSSGNKGYGSDGGYGSRGGSGYSSGGNKGYGSSGGDKGYGSSSRNSHRGNPWESDPWRDGNSYSRGSGGSHHSDGYGSSGKSFGGHTSGYGGGRSGGSHSGYRDFDSDDHYGGGRVYRPRPKKVVTRKPATETEIINCPVQSNQSSVYKLNATGDAYPAIEIGSELFFRSQPGSDLFFFCLFPRAITPGQAPQLEVDQNFVTANMTCPSQDLTLFSYRYQNTAFGGFCWIVQGFQEVVTFSICMTQNCVNCKFKDLKKDDKDFKPYYHHHDGDDYGHNHHHHEGYGEKSNNVTVSRCFTEYRVVQVVSYCENLPLNQRIIYDRIVIPAFCNCKSYFCQKQDKKHFY